MKVTWTFLKSFHTSKSLAASDIKYVEIADFYILKISDGAFCFDCIINKNAGAEQVDFETNYKTGATVHYS